MKSYLPPEYIVERDQEKCIRCKVCVNQCTYETHSYDAEDDVIRSKDENCVNCQRCVTFCPTHAITIKKNPSSYRDNAPREAFLDWCERWCAEVRRVLKPDGSFFLNVGAAPANPWFPHEVVLRLRNLFVLQNTLHWVKSITTMPARARGD